MQPLITKTLVRSAAVLAVFPLHSLDSNRTPAIVAVYSDHIRVYAITSRGQLRLWHTEAHLGGQVISADLIHDSTSQLGTPTFKPDPDSPHTQHHGSDLLLVLSSATSLVLSITSSSPPARLKISCRSIPLPASLDPLRFVGTHLAVDPRQRAIAFAAHEHALLLVSYDGCQRHVVPFEGTLHSIVFLQSANPHLVILTIRDRIVSLKRIHWSIASGLFSAQLTFQQHINAAPADLGLMISMRDRPAVLISIRDRFTVIECPESGSGRQCTPDSPWESIADSPGWVAGSTSISTPNTTVIAREDGHLCLVDWKHDGKPRSRFVSTAWGSCLHVALLVLPNSDFVLVCFNDLGAHVSCLDLGSAKAPEITQIDHMHTCSTINNVSEVPETRGLVQTPTLYAVCGRQPNATMSEIRMGCNAKLLPNLSVEGLNGCIDVHVLHRPKQENIILLFSFPAMPDVSTTLAIQITDEHISNYNNEDADSTIDLFTPTLAVFSCHAFSCHVTCGSASVLPHIDDVSYNCFDARSHEQRITCAAVDSTSSLVLIATESCLPTPTGGSQLLLCQLPSLASVCTVTLSSTIEALCLLDASSITFAFAVDSECDLHVFRNNEETLLTLGKYSYSGSQDSSRVCKSLLVLQYEHAEEDAARIILACGLGDGYLFILNIFIHAAGEFTVTRVQSLQLGATSIRVMPYHDPSNSGQPLALALVDSCMFIISRKPHLLNDFTASRIWVSDSTDLGFIAGPVIAMAHIPATNTAGLTELNDTLIFVAEGTCRFAQLDREFRIVARSVKVTGTPTRIFHSAHLSHFVVGAVHSGLHDGEDDTQTAPGTWIRGRLEFHAPVDRPQDRQPPFFPLQAHERVFGITDWVYRSDGNKKYVFLLVATGIFDGIDKPKGRIQIIQPVIRRGKIEGCSLAMTLKLDEPVHAIAICGETSFVAATESSLMLYGYQAAEKKWTVQSKDTLSCRAVHLSVDDDLVYVTTAADSLVKYAIVDGEIFRQDNDVGAYQGLHHFQPTQVAGLASETDSNHSDAVSETVSNTMPNSPLTQLMTTRQKQIRGFGSDIEECVLHTQMKHSIIRLVEVPESLVVGEGSYRLLGVSTNGTIQGLAFPSHSTWSILRYIQTLCERSKEICSRVRRPGAVRHADSLPLGLKGLEQYDFESKAEHEARVGCVFNGPDIASARWRPEDAHIDADTLQCLVQAGKGEALRRMLEAEATRHHVDRVSQFVSRHLQTELELVDSAMALVEDSVYHFEKFDACLREGTEILM